MAVMGSPHGVFVWENKLTMFRAHYPFCGLDQLAKTKVKWETEVWGEIPADYGRK